jgi:putative heme-binding domain-containing protein
VVFPSASLAQGFETYRVTTAAGKVLTGTIARQTADVVVLRDSTGAETRVPRDTIESLERQGTSLMPDSLARALTREELRDLLAFLRSLK